MSIGGQIGLNRRVNSPKISRIRLSRPQSAPKTSISNNLERRLRFAVLLPRASQAVVSMEEEAHMILRSAIEAGQPIAGRKGLGSRIHEHFAQLGGVDPELPARSSLPVPAPFAGAQEGETSRDRSTQEKGPL